MTQLLNLYQLRAPGSSYLTARPIPQVPDTIPVRSGQFRVQFERGGCGVAAGVETLSIAGNRCGVTIIPTRGMGIWKAWAGNTVFGWNSPVQGPVHPALVPLTEPSGLGWLSGFDELLVRCGLESNGAPEFDDQHRLRYPLHGRIANTPAESLAIEIDAQHDTISVTGVVREARLFFSNWTLTSTLRMQLDADWIEIEDSVTNHANSTASHQMLYHINVGSPVLEQGARLIAPFSTVVPKTPRAMEGVETFDTYGPPETGFAEQVYLCQLQTDDRGWTGALLSDAQASRGVGVEFDTTTLPYFIQWKNTGGERDGYVTGLEPATNFPNRKSFEASHGRVANVGPGDSITHRLRLHLLAGSDRVEPFARHIAALATEPGDVKRAMRDDWCE